MSLENNLKDGLAQRIICKLTKAVPSTVSRCIAKHKIPGLDGVYHERGTKGIRYSLSDARKIIKDITNIPRKVIKKKHAFYNFKGGTGKTSLCFQIAHHLSIMGYNVLAIDADPQAHLSTSFGLMSGDCMTLYDVITQSCAFEEAIIEVSEGLACIPSNLSLTKLEVELSGLPKREERMLIDLKPLENKYDFILIDTNPTISVLNRNVICYSDSIHIVCETHPYSLNGLKILIDDLEKFFRLMLVDAKHLNIIPNKYEDRSINSAECIAALRKYYGQYLSQEFIIRRSEDIITSSKVGKPLAYFAKTNSNALQDIIDLMYHIINFSTDSNEKNKK